ncbi:MAG: OmpA family protein, partial [Campylobacterota bacterium]|nr:OmpA family protein [Campylobacterota bacterium]
LLFIISGCSNNEKLNNTKIENNETILLKTEKKLILPIIKIDTPKITDNRTPTICGDIKEGNITNITIELMNNYDMFFGPYDAEIENNKTTWCSYIGDELENDEYTVLATAIDNKNQLATDKNTFEIYLIDGLYDALIKEFQYDLQLWNAQLEEESLLFRFNNSSVLFNRREKTLKQDFKNILNDFFPRYNKVLLEYKDNIKNVYIEGHASSEHRLGSTKEEKYKLNQILSQQRAEEVLRYTKSLEDNIIIANYLWIDSHFQAIGKSSSELIYNEDGSENKHKSRRVDFRIETIE